MAQHAALDTRIELGQRIVQQEHRGAADRLFDGGRFRETQCQRHQALLSPRSERSEVTSLQRNEEIVSVGTNERLAPADLLRKTSAQELMKRRRCGRITQCRSILDSNTPTTPQRRIQAFRLRAQSHDALPAPGHNLHAEIDDLLIPRFETTRDSRRQSGGDDCDAREPVDTSGGSTHTTGISLRRTHRGSCGAPAAPH